MKSILMNLFTLECKFGEKYTILQNLKGTTLKGKLTPFPLGDADYICRYVVSI